MGISRRDLSVGEAGGEGSHRSGLDGMTWNFVPGAPSALAPPKTAVFDAGLTSLVAIVFGVGEAADGDVGLRALDAWSLVKDGAMAALEEVGGLEGTGDEAGRVDFALPRDAQECVAGNLCSGQ